MIEFNHNPSYSLLPNLAFQPARLGLHPSYCPLCSGVIRLTSQISFTDDRLVLMGLFKAFDAPLVLLFYLTPYPQAGLFPLANQVRNANVFCSQGRLGKIRHWKYTTP